MTDQDQEVVNPHAERRAAERAAITPVPLTVDALLAKLQWSREYAKHVVQPYCECWNSYHGWETCPHADDLGVSPTDPDDAS